MSADKVASVLPDYYPPGFDYDHLVQATRYEVREIIGRERMGRFRAGLLADRGQEFLIQYNADCADVLKRRRRAETDPDKLAKEDLQEPDFVEALLKWSDWPDEAMREWGWVVFRTAGYGNDRWSRAKPIWDEIIDASFRDYVERGARGARDAQQKFKIHWIEGPEWEDASPERMAEYYRTLADGRADFIHHALFLCINDASLESLLAAPHPLPAVAQQRMHAVIVLAIDSYCGLLDHNEGEDEEDPEQNHEGSWCGYFYLEAWCIVGDLFSTLAHQTLEPYELGCGTCPHQINMGLGERKRIVGVEKPYRI